MQTPGLLNDTMLIVSESPARQSVVRKNALWIVLLAVLVAIGAVLVIVYVVRGGKSAAVIRVPNPDGGSAGMLLNNVPAGTPAYTQTYSLCSSTGAPVTIQRVEPVKATGPVTVAWGVHHGQFSGVDSGYGPLSKLPGFTHRAVTEKCSEPYYAQAWLGVAVTAPGPVGIYAFKVIFKGGAATVPFAIETCPGKHCPRYPGLGGH